MANSPLPRHTLAALNERRNWPSAWRLALHLGLLCALGTAVVFALQSAWAEHTLGGWRFVLALACWLAYGVVFSFLGYAGLGHELAHHTVFSSRALNVALFHLVSFLSWSNPVYFRASHRVHHQHTLQQGVDYEVNPDPYPLLERWWRFAVFDTDAFKRAATIYWNNTRDRVPGPFGQGHFAVGTTARRQLVHTARWHVALHTTLALVALALGFWPWVLLLTLAAFVCTLPNRVLAKLQHAALPRNAGDLRHNTRTLLLPKPLAFLYWNMNYHTEHHLHPSVPYYNLPRLRTALAGHLPHTAPGLLPHLHALRMPAQQHSHPLCKEKP
ncbi:fatty acid desaturase [Limnobacter sp.]|uniref:fatty acid desaturase n=1 Tax=Limnobacter sp. TaxID=2003368 RepID=UPI0035150B52